MAKWQNPDVHARTHEMVQLLRSEFPDLPARTVERSTQFGETVRAIQAHYFMDGEMRLTLEKMESRKGIVDRDLCGCMPAGLLSIVWHDYVVPNECFDHFKLTMRDMGPTCVQGDTHRLFASLVALHRSTKKMN